MQRRKQVPDFILFVVILSLLTVGIIMVFSSSYVYAQTYFKNGAYFFERQLLWALLGVVGMWVVMKIDYHIYARFANVFLAIAILLLLVLHIPHVSMSIKGSVRWINLGFASIQPSELVKLALVIYLAKRLSETKGQLKNFTKGLLPLLLVVGLICGLVMLQPDLGTTVTIAGTAFLMFMAAGAAVVHLVGLGGVGAMLVAVLAIAEPYRMARLLSFVNPWADPQGKGFQTIQSLYAVGSGRLFGMGLGQGRQKFLYLPERHTDFIFAILSEELGFIGAIFVVLLFFVFMWRGLKMALKAPDNFGALLAVGITSMVTLQAVINIGVVTGCLPVTGITLPFISYGGSSLMLNLLGMGILLNISYYVEE